MSDEREHTCAQADALMDVFGFKRVVGDRQLLVLAAMAAGLPYVKPTDDYDGSMGLEAGSENPMRCVKWDPLQDSADALWLAVKLKIDICFGAEYVTARGGHETPLYHTHLNSHAATRRAIVRAAAAIGESM